MNMKLKKQVGTLALAMLMMTGLAACGNNGGDQSQFDSSKSISVVSREDGSGTRGAFIELFGIEEKDAAGNKVDQTTPARISPTALPL